MPITLATGADYLRRTTGLVNCTTGPSTTMMWVQQATITANPHTFWTQLDNPGVYVDWCGLFGNGTECNIYGSQAVGSVNSDSTPVNRVVNTWFHITIQRLSSAGSLVYVNGLLAGSMAQPLATASLLQEYIGNDTLSDGGLTIAYCRQWNEVLQAHEIQIEMQSATVQKTANLWGNWPLSANINDISGNGRNWTQFGSALFTATAPDFPTNGTQATALALTGSDSITLDFGDGFIVWYSYMPSAATEAVLSFFAIASLSDLLTSRTFAAAQDPYPDSGSIAGENVPIQIPLLSSTTVWIRVYASDNLTTDATVTTRKGPTAAAPIGTILINDDTDGFPLALLSPTSGAPLQFVNPFPFGETAAVLDNGNVLLEDKGNSVMRLIDADLQTLGTVPYPWGAALLGALNSDRVETFYASAFNSAVVYQMDATGTVLGTFTVAVPVFIMCPNRDNTILYYLQAGTNRAVRRWDLVNDVALSDLATGVAGHSSPRNILVLSDDTILVAYVKTTATPDNFVRRYSAAGATLNTYTLADTTEKINWIQIGINDDSSSFLMWSFPTVDASSRFTYFTVSTGAILSASPMVPIFEGGAYQLAASLTPDAYFGTSKSCPIWVLAVDQPAPSNVNVREYLIRRERWFPVVSKEQHRLFFHKLQVYFEAGTGITAGQGSNPIVELDWSDDGGHTWSHLHLLETGKIGEYKRRIIQRMMGQSRERIYRVAVSDPVQWSLIDAFFDLTEGTS